MTRYVIDAPTLLALATEDRQLNPDHQLVAPNSVRSQALALLFAAVRAGALTDAEALRRHDRMTGLKMRLLGDRVSRRTAWTIARDQGWESIDDAEYLAVARLQADALITVDRGLAARADGVVPVAPFTALFID